MKISDIRTELFTQSTITGYGVRLVHFDDEAFKASKLHDIYKSNYLVTIHILANGAIRMSYRGTINLSHEQIDEIQRISQILRSEK